MAKGRVGPVTSGRGLDVHWPQRPATLCVVLAFACVVVPVAFSTRTQAVFVVPKLGVLWGLLAVCLGIAAFQAVARARLPSIRPVWVVDVAVLAFLGLTTLAWIFSTDGTQSLYGERLQHQGLLTTLLYVAWFYVARASISSFGDLRILLAAATVGGGLVAGYALVQKAGLDPVWHGFLPGGNVFSSIGQSNALAAYLVLVLPLAGSFAFDPRRLVRFTSLVVSVALLLGFVFAQSRGGYLGLVTAAVVVAVGWGGELHLERRSVIWAGAIVATIAAIAVVGEVGRLGAVTDTSARFHYDAWRVAAEIVEDHPLFGTGPETFPDVLPRYSHDVLPPERASALDAFRVESPHNVYFGIAAGSGLPALIVYLAAIASTVAIVIRTRRVAAREVRIVLVAVLGGIAGHLVTDAFMSPEVTSNWLAWVLLGGSLGAIGALRAGAARDARSGPGRRG